MSSSTTPVDGEKENSSQAQTVIPVKTTGSYNQEPLYLFQLVRLHSESERTPTQWVITGLDKQIKLSTLDFQKQITIRDIERLGIGFHPATGKDGIPVFAY